MAAFMRDYPKLQSKALVSKNPGDAALATSLFKNATDLLTAVGGETKPLGQVVDADGSKVIGFMTNSGDVVPAPLMTTVPGIPVVVSNNQRKYSALLKDAVTFSDRYLTAMARFKPRARH
jgi:hypothetical protein